MRLCAGGPGGGEAVGIGKLLLGTEFGREAGQVEVGINEFDGELGNLFDDLTGDTGDMGAPD